VTTFEMPGDGELQPVTLRPEQRTTLGSRKDLPPDQQDLISLGRPEVRRLDRASLDPDAQQFIDSRTGSDFWLIATTCSFRAVDDQPLTEAWLEIRLHTAEPAGAAAPTAYSMEPLTLADSVTVTTTVKLDGSLKLTSPVVPIEVGPSAGRQTQQQYTARKPYVEAFREGTSRPAWLFHPTPATGIRGVHRLRTVVELPAGATGRGEVGVGGQVRLKVLGLFPYRAPAGQLPAHQIVTFG
jgi:hypothetical protein